MTRLVAATASEITLLDHPQFSSPDQPPPGAGANLEDQTDTLLLQRWRSGDRNAADLLLRRYTPLLRAFFARRVSRNADELVQRTLLACVQNVARFEGRSTFRSYLFGIAQNQFFMCVRAESRLVDRIAVMSTAPEDTPSQLLAAKEQERVLLSAILQLRAELRSVLDMYYWQGLSVDAIASRERTAPGTVKSRLARGRALLKKQIIAMNLPQQVRNEVLTNLMPEDGSLDG